MLLMFTTWLSEYISFFSVFNYITLRAVLATLTSLCVGLILGPFMIRYLSVIKFGQSIRDDGPQSHLQKTGTPTMGGSLVLTGITCTTLLRSDLFPPGSPLADPLTNFEKEPAIRNCFQLVLRIQDIRKQRSQLNFVKKILNVLKFLPMNLL